MNQSQFLIPQRVNVDKDERALDNQECTYKLNLRTGLTHGGNSPSNENVMGTIPITNAYHDAGDVEIGSSPDISSDSILYFFYNPDATKHKIVRYFPYLSDRVDLVVKDALLNFQLHHKITSINIIDDLLYWTDGYEGVPFVDYNPPRKINLVKATAMNYAYNHNIVWYPEQITNYSGHAYRCISVTTAPALIAPPDDTTHWELANVGVYAVTSAPVYPEYVALTTYSYGDCCAQYGYSYMYIYPLPTSESSGRSGPIENPTYFQQIFPVATPAITQQILDRIKWPPAYAPGPSYDTDLNFPNNLLRNKLFQFSYRYVYDDNEKSVWSDISIIPLPLVPELQNGVYNETTPQDNVIHVWVNSGTAEVKEVDIAVREGNHGNWILIKRWYKYDQDGNLVTGMQNNINIVYLFYNNEVGEGMVQSDFNRPYDAVPQISQHEELIEKNRLSDEDYIEGYDNINLDVALTVNSTYNQNNQLIQSWDFTTSVEGTPNPPFVVLGGWTCSPAASGSGDSDQFGGYQIDFSAIYTPGYLYVINIEITPNVVYGTASFNYYTPEYWGKIAKAVAFVDATPTMTMADFLERIVSQLRYGSAMSSLISIIMNGDNSYRFFENYTTIDGWNGVKPNSLGIVAPASAGYGNPFWDNYHLNVTISQLERGSVKMTSFKNGITHKFGLVYFDDPSRQGAVNVTDQCNIYIPSESEVAMHAGVKLNNIRCEIKHKPPMWAKYYQWVYAKDSSISYFIQGAISDIGTAPVGDYIYVDIDEFISDTHEVLPKFNINTYEWQLGDRIRFLFVDLGTSIPTVLDFEIVGTSVCNLWEQTYERDNTTNYILDANGNKVVNNRSLRLFIASFDYVSYRIQRRSTIVEVYRPSKQADTVLYYPIQGKLPILNSGTANRTHGTISKYPLWDRDQTALLSAKSTLDIGNVYVYTRYMMEVFLCESMSYSDFFNDKYTAGDVDYSDNAISIGLPSEVNRNMRRQRYISNIRYSELYLENTQVNGLSTCYGAKYDEIPQKFGNINAASEVGDILRIIQREKCTSIYIGKVGFKQTPGQDDVVSVSESVIGTKYFHPEGYGTVFSESVVDSLNYTYFYDIYNACECRWSNNGVRQIVGKDSETGWDFGYKTYFRQKSEALLASGIENVNVYSAYEKEFENLIITFVDRVNPLNNETIMFHEPNNSWIGAFSWIPEGYGAIGNVLTGCLLGVIYKHNANEIRNFFYGVQYDSILEVVGHGKISEDGKYMVVIFDSLEIHTNSPNWSAPNTGDVSVKVNNALMQSRIKGAQFVDREGVKVATFGKDMMTSGVEKLFDLYNGQDLRGEAIKVRLQNTDTTEVVVLGLNINMQISE